MGEKKRRRDDAIAASAWIGKHTRQVKLGGKEDVKEVKQREDGKCSIRGLLPKDGEGGSSSRRRNLWCITRSASGYGRHQGGGQALRGGCWQTSPERVVRIWCR